MSINNILLLLCINIKLFTKQCTKNIYLQNNKLRICKTKTIIYYCHKKSSTMACVISVFLQTAVQVTLARLCEGNLQYCKQTGSPFNARSQNHNSSFVLNSQLFIRDVKHYCTYLKNLLLSTLLVIKYYIKKQEDRSCMLSK